MKILGFILVVMASSLAGFLMGKEEEREIKALIEWQQVLSVLQSEIGYDKRPLPAVSRILRDRTQIFQPFFEALSISLLENREGSLENIWREVAQKTLQSTGLSIELQEKIEGFGQTLGEKNDFLAISFLEREMEEIIYTLQAKKGKTVENKKLFRSLGILMGVLVGVLLL